MTFEQIGYFLALAEQKSFVRAARRCGISQPSLSNAIKSLEAALGAPLFERALAGSKLTAFGRQMHPLLAQLYEDRLRVFAVASSSSCALNPIADLYSRKKRLHSEPEQAGHIANLKRRTVAVLTGLLAFALVAIGTRAEARDRGVELLIRESLPMPVRCSRTLEPLFYCRHETPSEHSVVLDLTNSLDGPSSIPDL